MYKRQGKDNTWYTTNASGSTESNSNIASITGTTIDSAFQGGYFVPAAFFSGASSGTTVIINAGQDSSFAGTKTAGSGVGANGYGNFIFSPPSGYQAICTANLSNLNSSDNSSLSIFTCSFSSNFKS